MPIRYTRVPRHYKDASPELRVPVTRILRIAFASVLARVWYVLARRYISNPAQEGRGTGERMRGKYIGRDVYIPPTMSITPRVTRRLYERTQLAPDVKRRTPVPKFDGATRARSATSEISPSPLVPSGTSTVPFFSGPRLLFIRPFEPRTPSCQGPLTASRRSPRLRERTANPLRKKLPVRGQLRAAMWRDTTGGSREKRYPRARAQFRGKRRSALLGYKVGVAGIFSTRNAPHGERISIRTRRFPES